MSHAARIFNLKQSLEREVKDLYAKITVGDLIAPTAILELNEDIVLTTGTKGIIRNGDTVTLAVNAAASNQDDSVLVTVTGTVDAVVITVTPNDGTNNNETPVGLTTEELVELINTGDVDGKNITLTDTSNLLTDLSATGGDDTLLAHEGEGDGASAEFDGGGANDPTLTVGHGFEAVVRNGVGDYTLTLSDKYSSMKYCKAFLLSSTAQDIRFQLKSESVSSSREIRILALKGTTLTDPADDSVILVKVELKNTDGF